MSESRRILYCRCAFAKVVPLETKDAVLKSLADSGVAFDAVPELCEMSARKDATLEQLASPSDGEQLEIVACYPRAVKWLFHAAGAPLPEQNVTIHNMRNEEPGVISLRVLNNEGVEVASSDASNESSAEAG